MKSNGYLLSLALILAAVGVIVPGEACAANLTLGAPVVSATDGTVTIPLQLETPSSEEVAGLQCDIQLKIADLEYVKAEIGPAGRAAAKVLSANPMGRAKVRLILVGLNQNVIGEGVVANLLLRAPVGASVSTRAAVLDDIILSDPFGTRIPVTFSGAPADPPLRAVQGTSRGETIPWTALALLVLLGGVIFAITRSARQKRKPRHARRLRVKKRREN